MVDFSKKYDLPSNEERSNRALRWLIVLLFAVAFIAAIAAHYQDAVVQQILVGLE